MGRRYAIATIIAASLRDDMTPETMTGYLTFVCDSSLRGEGHEPASEHAIIWQEITQAEIDAELETQRREGITPGVPYEAGDWRVVVTVPTRQIVP